MCHIDHIFYYQIDSQFKLNITYNIRRNKIEMHQSEITKQSDIEVQHHNRMTLKCLNRTE